MPLLDFQALNIHLRIEDRSTLEHFEYTELMSPTPCKTEANCVIYDFRDLKRPKRSGLPVLCGFGEACFREPKCTDEIQPYVSRAPEVMLKVL